MKVADLTQEKLAEKADITRSYVQQLELMANFPSVILIG